MDSLLLELQAQNDESWICKSMQNLEYVGTNISYTMVLRCICICRHENQLVTCSCLGAWICIQFVKSSCNCTLCSIYGWQYPQNISMIETFPDLRTLHYKNVCSVFSLEHSALWPHATVTDILCNVLLELVYRHTRGLYVCKESTVQSLLAWGTSKCQMQDHFFLLTCCSCT